MKKPTFERYKRVIDEFYINGRNKTKAYQKEYKKSSDDNAITAFQKFLGIPRVLEYFESKEKELQKIADEEHDLSKDRILVFLRNMLEFDPIDVITTKSQVVSMKTGDSVSIVFAEMKMLESIPKEIRQVISSIKQTKEGVEVKFYDKARVIEIINKMLGYNAATKSNVDLTSKGKRIGSLDTSDLTDKELIQYNQLLIKIGKSNAE